MEEDTSPFSKPLSLKAQQEAQRRFQQALNIIDAANYKGAIQYLTLAIDKDPSVLEYYLTRARIHKLLNNLGMARADYKSVLKLDPDHQEARQGLKDTQAATQHPQRIPHQPKPKRFTVPDILFKEVFPSKKPSS
ncbi:MAG: hypothetical protein HC921_19130 [Synechococcaceae cyanobacterium SM2_3_1]|nr:hypothetical protein [Synechococcaceae cyanobacterium SM2_3_1]